MKFKLEGVQDIEKKMEELMKKQADLTPLVRDIGADMLSSVQMNFNKTKDPEGKSWDKLKSRNGKALNKTGGLLGSVSAKLTEDSATVGTNKVYAKTHQFGMKKGYNGSKSFTVKAFTRSNGQSVKTHVRGKNKPIKLPWGDIPARPFIGINSRMATKYKKMYINYLIGGNE